MKLYEVSEQYQELIAQAIEQAEQNGGVIPDELSEQIDFIGEELDRKIENCGKAYKNFSAEADAIAEEIKKLTVRQRSALRTAQWLKNYLSRCVPEGHKVSTPTVAISWRKSKQVVIVDTRSVPDAFCKITREPSKSVIKDAITSGEVVNGAVLVDNLNIQIK